MNKGINLISEICKYFKENDATITENDATSHGSFIYGYF